LIFLAAALLWTAADWTTVPAPGEIRGAALSPYGLRTWGDGVSHWTLPRLDRTLLAEGSFDAPGCAAGDDLVLSRGKDLLWLPRGRGPEERIDTGVELSDCLAATLLGRRGIVVNHAGMQLRFYERRRGEWRRRDLYSFYTPSWQGGLLLDDVDRDGRPDLISGNDWVRSPARWEEPWHIHALNLIHEQPLSARARLALADLNADGRPDLVWSQGWHSPARLAWFEIPADPRQLWTEHPLAADPPPANPQALAVTDFDGDGRPDILVGEAAGSERILLFRNQGGGRFALEPVAWFRPLRAAFDTPHGLLLVAPRRISLRALAGHRRR
jgi:hypothetical protein